MAGDGNPESTLKRLGALIGHIRDARRCISRSELIRRLLNTIDIETDDSLYSKVSERWLARLENGRAVKITRQAIEALCQALDCSPEERYDILVSADRNPLADETGTTTRAADILLRFASLTLTNDKAKAFIERKLADPKINTTNSTETLTIISEVITIIQATDTSQDQVRHSLSTIIHLSRNVLQQVFTQFPSLMVARGTTSEDELMVLVEKTISNHTICISTNRGYREWNEFCITCLPATKGFAEITIGSATFQAQFNDKGVLSVFIPSELLTSPNGPDLHCAVTLT